MSDTVGTDDVQPSPESPQKERVVSRRGRRLLIAIIIVLILALAAVSALLIGYVNPKGGIATGSDAGGLQWIRSIYGWGRTVQTQFVAPRQVSIDPQGVLYVSDPSTNQVFAFNPTGQFLYARGKELTPTVNTGLGATATGPDAALYALEPEMDRVRVMGPDGGSLGVFVIPNPLSIAYRNSLMVIGTKQGFAVIDANNGQPQKLVGTNGKGPNQFDAVSGIAIGPQQQVYLVDTYNNRLDAYRADGAQLWSVVTGAPANKVEVKGAGAIARSTETSAPAQLQLPVGIAVDGNGRLIVLDGLGMSVSVFDSSNGKFIAKYGEYGAKDGQLSYPSGIAYDAQRDWFAVADTGNQRVQIFRIPGSGAQFNPAALARRSLAGPLRACLIPLILLIIMVILYFVNRNRRKKADAKKAAAAAAAPVELPDSVEE